MYSAYTKEQIKNFFNRYGESIIGNITDTDLFFPGVIAQLSMESKWGTSAPKNNFAGIKATGSQFSSGSQLLDTTEYIGGKRVAVKQSFATYATFDNFMRDYIRVLRLPNYVAAGVYRATTPEEQILAIAKGGYSTADPMRYLNDCRGRIEAARDEWKFGKISRSVTAPTVQEPLGDSSMSTLRSGIMGSITASIGSAFKKPS
jgi:hypothetical protein